MAIEIRTKKRGQKIINNSIINVRRNGGEINVEADDGTTLIRTDAEGITTFAADGKRAQRIGVMNGNRAPLDATAPAGIDVTEIDEA